MRTDMRFLFLGIAMSIVATAAVANTPQIRDEKFDYVDASTLTIINKAIDDGAHLKRLDIAQFEIPKGSRGVLSQSTGLAVLFRTDSRSIRAYWTTTTKRIGYNSTPLFQNGLDLYIRDNEEWVFAGVGRPLSHKNQHGALLVSNMAEGVKECMLYLPMANGVVSLDIAVDKGAMIEAIPSPFKHKIVFVGSSITHGYSASRPGGSYVARMGRALNVETPNIGLSGRCKLDDYFADIVCASSADAYIFDAFSNPSSEQIEERLYNFVKRITTAHPNTPMIFLQTLKRDKGNFDVSAREYNDRQRAVAKREMARVCADFKNVYFVDPGIYVGEDSEGTIDGIHLNDLGVQRTLDVALPKIKKILKKYKIR